jgi:hypothetical protein
MTSSLKKEPSQLPEVSYRYSAIKDLSQSAYAMRKAAGVPTGGEGKGFTTGSVAGWPADLRLFKAVPIG